jgi:hypothetical protein
VCCWQIGSYSQLVDLINEFYRLLHMEGSRTVEEEIVQEHGLFFSILFIFCVFFGIFVGFFVSWFNLIYIALHKVSL